MTSAHSRPGRGRTGSRVWIGLARSSGGERVVADTSGERPSRRPPRQITPSSAACPATRRRAGSWSIRQPPHKTIDPSYRAIRVVIEAADESLGSIWATRPRSDGEPGRSATRLLAAAADQIGQAIEQDRLAAEARSAEVARRSDAVKTALLESVSHDLRTPLATIRAAAGTILEGPEAVPEADRLASAEAIDREAEHLNRMVTNLLDLGRIEGGALRADREALAARGGVAGAVDRYRSRLADGRCRTPGPTTCLRSSPTRCSSDRSWPTWSTMPRLCAAGRPDPDRRRARRRDGPDHGRGLPAPACRQTRSPHLFEKFYRAGPAERDAFGHRNGAGGRPGPDGGDGRRMSQPRTSDLGGLAVEVACP